MVFMMYEVEIKRLDDQGRGIAFIDNKITFIKNALPEERVVCKITKRTKKYNVGEVIEYKTKSKKRIEAKCPYFSICGGCTLEHLDYPDTIEFKKEKLKHILEKEQIKYSEIQVVENENYYFYRNKLSLKVIKGAIGFYEENSHTLIPIEKCLLARPVLNNAINVLKTFSIQNGEAILRSNTNDEVLISINTKDSLVVKEENFANVKIVGIVLNDKCIYGQSYFYERIHHLLFKISYDAFFQVNPFVASHLFEEVEKNISMSNTILDLYSGVGVLGIVASKKAKKVISIEIIKNAVLDNIENCKLNKRTNIYPVLGDAKTTLPKIKEDFDTILIDPPRKGLDKNSLELLLQSKAQKILYISCDPFTLARDLKELQHVYEIKKVILFDMFSYTYHLESMVVLEKNV